MIPHVWFGHAEAAPPKWRDAPHDDRDDDAIGETPPDVIEMLGFDPASESSVLVHIHDGRTVVTTVVDAKFDESKHHRGQPGNSGQFGPGGAAENTSTGADPKHPDHYAQTELEKPLRGTSSERDRIRSILKLEGLTGDYREALQVRLKTSRTREKANRRRGEESANTFMARNMAGREHEVLANAHAMAKRMGVDPSKIKVDGGKPPKFKLGGQEYNYAGAAFLHEDRMVLYSQAIRPGNTVGVAAHELMHLKFQAVWNDYRKQSPATQKENFPVLHSTLRDQTELARTDGITDYSKQWWQSARNLEATSFQAIHETLAEMAHVHAETGRLRGAEVWKNLYRSVVKHYPAAKK